jgi:hypothetical protein
MTDAGGWIRRSQATRRTALLALLGALLLLASATTVLAAPGRSSRAHARARASSAIGFSHAAVVDEQRPGFEPDVKIDGNGNVYTSVPFGFSTTQSFVWSSRDSGNSYQLVPGNIGPGKPTTCVGGGDTDLFIDAKNALYFSDLQGLTNITDSKSTDGGATWTTNCLGAPNTPDDRMWFAGTGTSADGNLTLYQDYDAVNSALPSGGNQLVETISHDGTTFTPVLNTAGLTSGCGGLAINCVTDNEGISGNQVVDPATGNVYIAHTTINANSAGGAVGVQVSEGKITQGTTTSGTWTESPNLDAALCPDKTCVDSAGNPEELAGENFASIARDSAGYLYVTYTAGPLDHANSSDPNFGALTAPEQIYVVHSLEPAGADPSALTWSAPQLITGSGSSAGTNTFPWITAGSDGRVDIVWYHTSEVSEQGTCASGSGSCTVFGAGNFKNAEWTVQMGQSLNASATSPSYATSDVSETFIKHGQICTNGLGCATGGDRSLGDFLQVSTDAQGAAVVSYVFDTSNDTAAGEDTGPEVIARQISGPGLLANSTVGQGSGPGVPMGSATDPTGDDDYSANGSRTAAGDNLDLTGATLANGENNTLIATIHVKSLASLTAKSGLGGADASWILRWTVVTPGKTGNGHIYYVGMDNNAGIGGSGNPTFFDGDTAGLPPANAAEHTKYMTFPKTHVLNGSQASYDKSSGVITIQVPLSDVGSPTAGAALFSGTAFSATSTTPQSASTLFNVIDSTTPLELVIGAPGTVGTPPTVGGGGGVSGGGGSGGGPGNACPAATGHLLKRTLGKLKLGVKRTRARKLYKRYSTRGHRYTDFYCLSPIGIRASYPTSTLLRKLSGKDRRHLKGRLVLALTANSFYALHGVHPGTPLGKAKKRLKVHRGITIGKNTWYVVSNGPSSGILKVQHGIIREVGIATKSLNTNRKASKLFLRNLRAR